MKQKQQAIREAIRYYAGHPMGVEQEYSERQFKKELLSLLLAALPEKLHMNERDAYSPSPSYRYAFTDGYRQALSDCRKAIESVFGEEVSPPIGGSEKRK